ncbi:t-box transcription factor tbx20-like protein [Lasius niger]|uniref:T-box transcription factor tbx20-like protein n=1 Tax=Lasius niger TaxID=67767 RepID=A0A0J7KSB7_LASNI|nr:t-box transcription factor tbx20-like protein [Lasius niger]
MELMEQQLVRCGVAPMRLYEQLAMSSSSAAVVAALNVQQQQQSQHHQPSAQQQQQQQQLNENALSSWLSPSTALLYGARGAAGSPSPYSTAAVAAGFPYSPALPWPWQPPPPPPPVAMISRRSSPTAPAVVRYAPYLPTASPPPSLRTRPSTPN